MQLGKYSRWIALLAVALVTSACSLSSSGGSGNAIRSAVQDLTVDPDGTTTLITFAGEPDDLLPASFEADGGQTAQTVVAVGRVATVTWDQRVTPSHRVRAVGVVGVSQAFRAVTTSDASAPTFAITSAVQNPGLGMDTLVLGFSGPHVVPSQAEDLASWILRVNGQALDLTGSVLSFDASTQVLDVTLGPGANLHAAFTLQATGLSSVADVALAGGAVVGAATGDTTAPALLAADQNLAEDEYGRVVDFIFDEAMDPVFSTGLAHFDVAAPELATSVAQPLENVLRVSFSGPVVPGQDTVTLTGLVDAHGNAFPDGAQPVTQPAPAANAFDGSPTAATVQNALGDVVTVVTTQALDPDAAIDPASWALNVDGAPVDLSTQTVEYDFLAKTLTITLDFDMTNGDAFDVTGNALEVDGETFADAFAGVVAGDASEPTLQSALQNRTLDPTGKTVEVQLSEDVRAAQAQNPANWSLTGGPGVVTAVLQPSLDVVRLTLDAPAVPGDVTLGADGLVDLAGNAMSAPQSGLAVTSTDGTPPQALVAAANAIEGANNDTLLATFGDDMIETEVEDPSNWSVESPAGTILSLAGATISYNVASRRTTLTFNAARGVNLRRGDDFEVAFTGMRDIGGNTITGAPLGGPVNAETRLPGVHTVYRDGGTLNAVGVRFTEPCGQLDDLYDATTNPAGTRYVLRTAGGTFIAHAQGAIVLDDGLGASVSFGVVVGATDVLDVLGVEDLAGNPLFPALAVPTVAEDASLPSLDTGLSTLVAVSGESNDVVTVVFDRPMSPWRLLNPANYELDPGGPPLSLNGASFAFDGDRTVTIGLASRDNLLTGAPYDLSINDVRTAQGVLRSVADTELGILAAGDALAPDVPFGRVRRDPQNSTALLIEADEALDPASAEIAAMYDYDGGNLALVAELLAPRTVRATFAVVPTVGQTIDLVVTDLAGNFSGVFTRAVTAADAQPPLIVAPSGVSVEDLGGDTVTVGFSEQVDPATAGDAGNYAVHSGAALLDLAGATIVYDSTTQEATIHLAPGQELDVNAAVTVTVSDVADLSGNALAAPVVAGGTVTGDATPPDIASAFVNWREDAGGLVVDVLFSEDVDAAFVEDEANWVASGGQGVLDVALLNPDFARVQLAAPLLANDTLDLLPGLTDAAQNANPAMVGVTPEP